MSIKSKADIKNIKSNGGKIQKIQVHHEWGALKEVVVGIPFYKIPEKLPGHLRNFFTTAGFKFLQENRGKTIKEAAPELHSKMTQQMNDAIKILEDRDIKVHRPEELNELELRQENGKVARYQRTPFLLYVKLIHYSAKSRLFVKTKISLEV